MLFNSLDFAVFLPVVFILYWFVFNKSLKLQNAFVLLASYVFYGWWDWRFLSLIIISSLVDFLAGRGMASSQNKTHRKLYLYASVLTNLGILGFFKYSNFFIESFVDAFVFFGGSLEFAGLNIILPVGISFYTLQTLSYTLDVYDGKLKPTKNVVAFFAFVSFFPQLLAGPIERASSLLPQLENRRTFDSDMAKDGLRQILWGLFKKMVIADNLAQYTATTIIDYDIQSGSTLLAIMFFVIIQFYCDFSGYSDVAIGVSRLFGFKLMKNFDFPFFARNISEFWNKWHISLITWLRDYIIRRMKGFAKWKLVRNVLIIFVLSGLWHGAQWHYVFWGFLQALLFVPMIIYGRNKAHRQKIAKGKTWPNLLELWWMFRTFALFAFTGLWFRSKSVWDGFNYVYKLFDASILEWPHLPPLVAIVATLFMFLVEWLQRETEHGLDFQMRTIPKAYRWIIYYVLIGVILYFQGVQTEFIYFQF